MQEQSGGSPQGKRSLQEQRVSVFQNWFSVIGSILSVVFFSAILVLAILDFRSQEVNPYLGIVTYMIAPVFLVISLILIPLGALWEHRLRLKGEHKQHFPVFDFNNPRHQRRAYFIIGVVTVFLLFTIVGIYRAYEFTESVTFCGQTCHQVMSPEYKAYQHSPHARVACVECHVGSGVGSYVRSKLAGTNMLYSLMLNKYHRPVETPIRNLRPAQDTCEKCHWPQKFFGAIEKDKEYFLSDEKNTAWTTRMLLFVGGAMAPYGKGKGIHWHMNINNKITYVATDKKRQVIPWVKIIHPDGQEDVYIDTESKNKTGQPPVGEIRRMDCMDCHNRPSHNFKAPFNAVNEAMSFDLIDRSLPFIKREAVKALDADYPSEEAAVFSIQQKLEEFYKNKYPQVYADQKNSLDRSIAEVVDIYKTNMFPSMKSSWKAYPENIGHLISSGCFRCHDNKHKTSDGKVLSNDCTLCHSIIEQGHIGSTEKSADGLPFRHPEEGEEGWKEGSCVECHTGGSQ